MNLAPLSPEPPPLSGCHGVTHHPQLGGKPPGHTSPAPRRQQDISPGRQTRGNGTLQQMFVLLIPLPVISVAFVLTFTPPYFFLFILQRIKDSEQAVSRLMGFFPIYKANGVKRKFRDGSGGCRRLT